MDELIKDTIEWSHSKLDTILNCPMSYYLRYVQGISPKKDKPAFEIGSAVHWGIEHDTYDLIDYYSEKGQLSAEFTADQLLAQAIDYFYQCMKPWIYEKILTDPTTGEKLELLEEIHEGNVYSDIPSQISNVGPHKFMGIVDLLFRTNKGIIIIDFKTSTYEPSWDNYLDQLYRYIYLVSKKYPNESILKIGIVNLRKSKTYKLKTESAQEYFTRLCTEYLQEPEKYVDYHEYPYSTIDEDVMNRYIFNLQRMIDTAYRIQSEKAWYINYSAAITEYGKSDYYDIFYETKDAYKKYKIRDKIWSDDVGGLVYSRDCTPLDMKSYIYQDKLLNHYKDYVSAIAQCHADDVQGQLSFLAQQYVFDENLIRTYAKTFTNLEERT